jgi:thiamine pyrophosphokinase
MSEPLSSRTIIIANGHLPDPARARGRLRSGDRIICADGGAHHAAAIGLTPDVVVGDLDSLRPGLRARLEAAGVRFERHPERKDETDLELALRLAVAEGAADIEVWAMLGGRLDHSLANVMLLARPEWAPARVCMVYEDQVAWPLRGGQEVSAEGSPGDLLSLVPLSPVVEGVTLEGVEWPLRAATLRFGSTWTISNRMVAPAARLKIEDGLVLVVQQAYLAREEEEK